MSERKVPRNHAESLAMTERELRQEMASALGRMGNLLEEQLTGLAMLAALIADLPPDSPLRPEHLAKHEIMRQKAELYFWYMTVQREALGLTDHTALPKVPGSLS